MRQLHGGEVLRLLGAHHAGGEEVHRVLPGPPRRRQRGAAVPHPGPQPWRVRLHPVGELLESLGSAERHGRLTGDEPQQPRQALVGEILGVTGVGVQGAAHVIPVPRRPGAHSRVQPPAGQQVHGGQVLREPQRVLPAERDHRGAELDPRRALRRGREHGDRRGDAELQVPVPNPRAVEAEPLPERDHLERGLMPGARIAAVEQADGQEAEFLQRVTRLWHACPSPFHSERTEPSLQADTILHGL
jgi:hypothetical protein